MPRRGTTSQAARSGAWKEPGGVEPARDQRAECEGERDRGQRVSRIQHRRVDHHARVPQQRRQPVSLDRRRIEQLERVREHEHQRHEEAPEAEQHSRRVRSDLAQPLPGRDQRQAGPTRQKPHPQQQRTLLRRPQRRQLVEGRRGGARMARDEPEREVGAQEGRLEDDHGDRQGPEERVHRAASYRHPLRSSGACAVQRARDADQRARQREDETSASERQHLRRLRRRS